MKKPAMDIKHLSATKTAPPVLNIAFLVTLIAVAVLITITEITQKLEEPLIKEFCDA